MTPAVAIDLELMRVSALLETDPAAAVRRAGALLEQSPGHEGAQLLLATACRNLGDADTAQDLLGSLARAQPGSATLQLEFGRACAAAGRHAEALTAFEVAVALDDRLADAWHGLAAERFIAGDTHGGDQAYVQYDRLAPQPPEFNDAAVALGDRRLDVAIAVIRQRLQKVPDDVRSLRMLATIARARDDTYESEEYLKQCLEPTYGVIVYQEQVMEIARAVSGFSMAEADNLRKAMGKKKPELLEEQRDKFIEGAAREKVGRKAAEEIFELINDAYNSNPGSAIFWTSAGGLSMEPFRTSLPS
jgi:tetratricopeptide (TPR) repeat protein